MSEYDAFGRKKGEDPLAGLGGESVEHATSSPAPPPDATVPPPYAPQQPAPIAVPAARPRPKGTGCAVLFVGMILVIISGAVALVVFGLSSSSEGGFSVAPSQISPAAVPDAPAPVQGLERGSLIRRDELTKALQTIRAAELGGIVSLRVDPEDVSAQIKTRDTRLRHVTVTRDGLTKGAPSGPGFGHIETFAARDIDPAAPQRLVRAATRRMKRSPDDVDYLVLMDLSQPIWGLFFKDGVHFQGTAKGRIIRRTS